MRRQLRDAQGGELRYQPALDGLRAVAVLMVLLYHGGVRWMGGGFLGVEVFFVLSGFLITSLLLAEQESSGIRLGEFWLRRARRLLPALVVLVVVCCAYELSVGPARAAPDFGTDALATLGYVANWHQLWTGSGYFAQAVLTSPLQHTWSLAIEEQFYLCWPLVVLALCRVGRSRAGGRRHLALLGFCVAGMADFAAEAALLYGNGSGLERVYYGTDTRSTGLLAGALLAVLVARRRSSSRGEGASLSSRLGEVPSAAAGILGAIGLALLLAYARGDSSFLYRGGFLAVDLSVLGIIVGATAAGGLSPIKRLLSLAPLRGIGLISYGLYLWHFPLMEWLTASSTGLYGAELLALRLGATLAAALISFFLVEQPVRQRRLGRRRLAVLAPAGGALAVTLSLLAWSSAGAVVTTEPVPAPRPVAGHCSADVLGHKEPLQVCPPLRVLFVGDSIALTLGIEVGGFRTSSYGLVTDDQGRLGCAFAERGLAETMPGHYAVPSTCKNDLAAWRADERRFRPDVVVVEMGYFDETDWLRNGRIVHLGEPRFDAALAAGMHRMVAGLASRGIPLVLLSVPVVSPPPWPDGSPAPQASSFRHHLVDEMLQRVSRQVPGVSYFDLGPYLTRRGHYAAYLDGSVCRDSDGIHLYDGMPHLVQTACGARLQSVLIPYLRKVAFAS